MSHHLQLGYISFPDGVPHIRGIWSVQNCLALEIGTGPTCVASFQACKILKRKNISLEKSLACL